MKGRPTGQISENALLLFPLLRRLLTRRDPNDTALVPFKNHSYHILRILEREGPLPMSAIGKRLAIAKQNMTTLVDRLMHDGLVERRNDTRDRRVINIVITETGIEFLKESLLTLKRIIEENLSELSPGDIESLDSAFQTIREVVSKLENGS